MYNATWAYKNSSYKIEKIKWADSLKSITKLTLYEKKTLEIKIFYDTKINKKETSLEKIKEKSKSSRGFLFTNAKDKSLFLSNLRRIFYTLTSGYLKIELTKWFPLIFSCWLVFLMDFVLRLIICYLEGRALHQYLN